jgi:hypothetical protein
MAINDTNRIHSIEHIFNASFDKEHQMLGVELIGYDPLASSPANALKRITVNALGEYATNDIEEVGAVTYVGKEDPAGDWYLQKIDKSSGTSIRYATVKNNATYTNYTDAWTDRASLTYGTYSQAS